MEGLAAPDAAPPGMVGRWSRPFFSGCHIAHSAFGKAPSTPPLPLLAAPAPLLHSWAGLFCTLGTLLPPHGAPLLAQPSWDGVGTTLCLP